MKNKLFNSIGSRLGVLIVAGLLTAISASADFTLFDQTFDVPFGPTQSFAYGYFGGDITNSAYSVVAGAGTNGSSALELTNSAAALGNGYGYAAVVYQETALTGNTNVQPAAYTLSFDARTSVANANGLEVRVIDANGGTLDTAPNPPGYGNDRTLTTTYTHYTLNLGDPTVFMANSGFNPTTPTYQILFQNNAGGGGNPPAWAVDIDNIQVTVAGTVPPPPPVTIYPLVKVPKGLNLYAGTEANLFYDRQEVVAANTTGLGFVGRATVGNPVSYSFTVNSFPGNSSQGTFEMFLVPNAAYNNAADYVDPACVETFLAGNSTNATLRFTYKVSQPNGNTMLLGQAPYTNAPGSWNGITTPYYESGALGTLTDTNLLGTWTVEFTSSSNVTLLGPSGISTNLVIPPYNVSYLAEGTSFNIYLGEQPQEQAAINQSFNYANFAVTGVLNPFSDNFLADTKLNTNIWNSSVATAPSGVFVSSGNQKLVTWSTPAVGFSLQDAGQLTGPWTILTQGPNPVLYGLLGQVVSTNELPAGNNAFFRLKKLTATQIQVLLPGETNAPNTSSGIIGTPTPISLSGPSEGTAVVTVNACDANWNIVSYYGDTITFSSSDGAAALPGNATFVNGTATATIGFSTTGSQTVTATDTNLPPAAVSLPVTITN